VSLVCIHGEYKSRCPTCAEERAEEKRATRKAGYGRRGTARKLVLRIAKELGVVVARVPKSSMDRAVDVTARVLDIFDSSEEG
jgi:hypothetical protein